MTYNLENEKAEEALEQFTGAFLSDRFIELDDLVRHLQHDDFKEIEKIAHSWKGFSKPYGFEYLGVLGSELEQASIGQDISKCQVLLTKVRGYLDAKKAFLGL